MNINENNESNISYIKKNIVNNNKNNKKRKRLFIVTHENNFNSKTTNKNNLLKIFKNKKIVYANPCILNSYSSSKNLKKVKNIAFITTKKRSSKYRGVSKNGNKWQVLFMNHENKTYINSYTSEEVAARIYDILSIKKKGIKARTNFSYNNLQIKAIKEMFIDIKSKNINDFINKLFQ